MKVLVLLASGELDTWEDVASAEIDMSLAGALVVTTDEGVAAIYAPSMWMRMEYQP